MSRSRGKRSSACFLKSYSYGIFLAKEDLHMNPDIKRLRKKYMDHPPEGITSEGIHYMSKYDLLDMDLLLNEDTPFDDDLKKRIPYLLILSSSYYYAQTHVYLSYIR